MTTIRYPAEPTPAEVRLVERFRDLERVTAGYWTHARLAGFAIAVLGAWLAASTASRGTIPARLALLSAPLAWAAATAGWRAAVRRQLARRLALLEQTAILREHAE